MLALALSSIAAPAFAQEGQPPAPPTASPDAGSLSADAPQAATSVFDIMAFQVKGNTLLEPDDVERTILPFMGPGKSEADVEGARAALQKLYEDKGYVAVSVYIPEQSVEGGVLQLVARRSG